MTDQRKGPVYTGIRKFVDIDEGYGIWLPSDWHRTDMVDGHKGAIFSPYPDRLDTCFVSEKHRLKYKVTQEDIPDLRKGFEAGLNAMPGVVVEKINEIITSTLITFEAIFTFEEEGQTRKRWVRNVYWGEGQLVMLAQGATPQEYEYWLPMFYNTMMTAEIGLPQ
jgi:hypothetical protein